MRHRQVRHRFAGLALGFGGLLIVTGLLIAQSKEYIRLGGRVIAIESSAGPATIAPPAGPLAVDAGVTTQQLFSVQVSPSSQTWSIAASGDPALALTNGASFVGNASPGYTWTSANPSTTADRTATLDFRFTPGGPVLASLTVIQRKAPAPGAPVLNPPNPLSVSATYCALTGATFAISGTGETSIGSSANAAWITGVGVTSPGPNRTVNYSLLANPNPASRTGAITVTATNAAGSASQTFAVTQSAQPSLALPPGPLVAANANAQSFPVSVTVQSGVVYTASLDVAASVATLLAAGPFTGTGSAQGLAIQFSANPLTAVRPVTLTIATNGGGCTVSASVVVNQPGQPTAVPSRTISFSPSAVNFPAPASSGSVTPLVSVNGVPQSGEAWMVTVSDPDAMVTLQSGTVVPNTQARCGVGALNYSIAQNTDGTKSQREAFLTFFPMAEGAACPSTARADTRPGPVNLLIAQTGPVSAEPTLSVTPSEFSGIPYQGTNSGLRTNVSANRYWDWVWSPSVFMRIGDGSWTPGSAPSWTGFVDGKALPNGDPLPRTDILFINTNNSGSTYAQKVVYFHQNPAPPATQAPSTESISVLDPSNSGGARGRFTLVASDLDGGSTITQGRLRIASGPTGNAACEAYVQKNGGGVYEYFLLSDNGTPTGPLSATVTSLANSQCILNGANSTVNTNGTSLSATFDLQFQLAYRGQPDPNTYNVYGRVKDVTSVDSGWQLRAYQTLAGTPPQLFVSPAQGGPSSRQVFTFDVREAFGDAAISQIYPSVMPPARELPGCSMQFDRASSLIQLYNFDLQTWASVAIAPTMNLVSPLCNIRGVTYTPGALGATMAIDLEFAAGFGGTQDVNGGAGNTYGKYLPNTKLGTWTVPQVAGFNFTGPTGSVAATVGVETTVNLQVTSFGGFQTPVSLQVQGLPGFTSPVFTPSSITGSGAVTLRFTPAGGTTGTYPVTVRATGGAIDKTVTFNLAVAGPAPLPRSLSLNGSATANTDQLSGLSRLTNLTDWRIDTRLHDYSGTTARTTLWTISGSVTVGLDIDPASNVLRLISNTENLTGACTVAYTGRTQLLVRVQRANGGQYSLQLWNSDGSGFAASTPANCNGAAAAQSFDNRLILGGDLYAQPGRAAGYAFWRLLSGLGAGAADPPAASAGSALLAYEFDQLTLADTGGQSPAGPVLRHSSGFGAAESLSSYVPTPPTAGGPPSSGTQSAVFDGTRSLTFEAFDGKAYLNNLSEWRIEARIHNFVGGTLLSIGGYALNIGTATGTTYLTDYNADGGRAVPYVCQVNMAGLPNDLTIRIERRTGGLRFLQFWDQQGTYYPPGLCWDTSTGSTTQNPRTTIDRLWPTSPTTPGRLGADTYNSDKFNGRVAWFRIYGAAANSNTAPSGTAATANLLYALEFDGNLLDQGPAGQPSIPPTAAGSGPTYETTPGSSGGGAPANVQSAVFDGTRSLTFEAFDGKTYLNNLSEWRIEARIHNFVGGTLFSFGGYTLSIGTATGTTYLTDYNADGGRAVPYVCQVNMAGLPNDLTIRIERRTGGLRFLQFWDQQGTYYPPGLCWDTSTGSTTQNPRTTNDRFWPTSPTTPGRLGADTYNSDKFNGRVAWFRIYGAAANSNSAPPTPYSTANLLFGAEFEGNLADSGPNSLVITSTATPFTFFAGTP